uniref:Proton-coupled amino acid transporter 4 n=1 Tax=Sipha flava TaxID=143950 RepID=A0A2S2QJZ7_9HEMI
MHKNRVIMYSTEDRNSCTVPSSAFSEASQSVTMDNPAADLRDDVVDSWSPTDSQQTHNQIKTSGSQSSITSTNNVTSTPSSQQQTQQQYKRNASTYSIDLPATLGLMAANDAAGANNTASKTSSTMKLTEYSSSGSNSSVGDAVLAAAYTDPGANNVARNGHGPGGRRRKGGKKQPRYDPFQMRDKSKATTDGGALLHLIKSSLGSGILAMPNAFKNGGLIFGLVGTAAIGTLCTHCIYLLVLCSQTLARRTRRPALGFADTAAAAFSTGPRRFRAWAPFARYIICLFCLFYLVVLNFAWLHFSYINSVYEK